MRPKQPQRREFLRWSWLQEVWRDFRFAVRLLKKERGFTLVAVTVLGLGIGVNNTQFILVNAICIRGLPIDRPDRVLFLSARDARDQELSLSYREFDAIQAHTRAFAGLAAFANAPVAVGDEGRAPDRALLTYLSAGAFRLLGATPTLGRDFEPADDRPGAPTVAILGSGLWTSRYGADPSIVGRVIRINGTPSIVIGVMAGGFRFPGNTEVWQPLALMPGIATERRAARALSVFGRLAVGAAIVDGRGQLAALTARLSHDYPETNHAIRLTGVPINDRYNGRITDSVWLAFLTVGVVVVLISCANVANLLLMRSVRRAHEMAIRASLGASRGRLVRQLIVESAALAALGGMLGLAFSLLGVRALARAIPANALPYWITFSMDGRVFAVLCGVCLVTVVVFGLAPAMHVSRTDVIHVMKEGGRSGSTGLRARRWTTAFLTAEFALTMMLLTTLALGVRISRAAQRADLAFNASNLITMSIALPADTYRSPDRRIDFYRQLEERLGGIAAVRSVAVTTALPLSGAAARQLEIDGRPAVAGETAPTVWTVTVSTRYFDALGLHLRRGRTFSDGDGTTRHEAAIVNQRFAEMYFSNDDPLRYRIRLNEAGAAGLRPPWLTIVGVSPTVRQRGLPDPDPIVYLPLRAAPPASAVIVARSPQQPSAIAPALRDTVRSIDPDLPLYRIMSMEQALTESQWNGRVSNMIITSIAFVAVCLAAIGLYAVTAHTVVQRTQEIGIRIALGAERHHVVRIVLRRAMAQLALGLVAGVGCTLAWERLFSANAPLSGQRMSDPMNLVAVSALLTGVALIACLSPAWRAMRVDPVVALRYE
jgi:putative ABC transport system permease protein